MTYQGIIMWTKAISVIVYTIVGWVLSHSPEITVVVFSVVIMLQFVDAMYTDWGLEDGGFDEEFFDVTDDMDSANYVGFSFLMGMCPILWVVAPVMVFISKLKKLNK